MQPSPVVLRRKPKDEAPQSLEPPLRDSTAHLRCPQFQLILCIINLIIEWAYESYIPKVEVPGVLNSTNFVDFQPNFSTASFLPIKYCKNLSKNVLLSSGNLGSPSKIRPTSVIASKNTRKRMEDRHVVLHDLKTYLPSNLQSKVVPYMLEIRKLQFLKRVFPGRQ